MDVIPLTERGLALSKETLGATHPYSLRFERDRSNPEEYSDDEEGDEIDRTRVFLTLLNTYNRSFFYVQTKQSHKQNIHKKTNELTNERTN
jgi:hypothetical protein